MPITDLNYRNSDKTTCPYCTLPVEAGKGVAYQYQHGMRKGLGFFVHLSCGYMLTGLDQEELKNKLDQESENN